jgi:hypothetical protein
VKRTRKRPGGGPSPDQFELIVERAAAVLMRELAAVQQASLELQTLRWRLDDYRRAYQRAIEVVDRVEKSRRRRAKGQS